MDSTDVSGQESSTSPDFDALARKTNESNVSREDFDRLFSATFDLPEWLFVARGDAPNFNPYIASKEGVADGQQMVRAFTDGNRLHRFAGENGLLDLHGDATMLSIPTVNVIEYLEQFDAYGVHGVWFNSDLASDGYFIPIRQLRVIKEHLTNRQVPAGKADSMPQQDVLANYGLSETADGDLDINLVVNKIGAVRFDASLLPFYDALVPALSDFEGTGDFGTLLEFDPGGISQLTENVLRNGGGPVLRARNFQYLNPKNGVHIAVASLHSNHLRHLRSGAAMFVNIELCKNLDNATGVLYHRFEGPRSDVFRLSNAFEPILAACGYEPVQ